MKSSRTRAWSKAVSVLVFALLAGPALAERPAYLIDRPIPELVRGAFSSNYGQLIVAGFAAVLKDSADADCMKAKGQDAGAEAFTARAFDILVSSGISLYEAMSKDFDGAVYEKVLLERAGPNAIADIIRLRDDPEIVELHKLGERRRFAVMANSVMEYLERHAVVKRLGLVRRVPTPYNGDREMFEESEAAESTEESEQFMKHSSSGNMKRWAEITLAGAVATMEEVETHKSATPVEAFTPDLGAELARVCVLPKTNN
jgi:hypothetical protein